MHTLLAVRGDPACAHQLPPIHLGLTYESETTAAIRMKARLMLPCRRLHTRDPVSRAAVLLAVLLIVGGGSGGSSTDIGGIGVGLSDATSSFANPKPQGESWAPCAFAVEQISVEGNGSTYGSCLACSPTNFVCPPKCQSLIDALYEQCDGVYAPQDFYFDPARTLNGYWNDHIPALRVQTARCGCSAALSAFQSVSLACTLAALATLTAITLDAT